MGQKCAIHINPTQPHQRIVATELAAGFKKHGVDGLITSDRSLSADTHVVIGPWYALDQWREHPRTLYIDRAYWGDPGNVSMHWLKDGEKHRTHCLVPRHYPQLRPYRESEKTIYLCDYQQAPTGDFDAYRLHPAQQRGGKGPLAVALDGFGVAVGRRTTALVEAAIMGLMVKTDDPHSPIAPISGLRHGREQWALALAWHNWGMGEIARGEAWEYLKQ